MKKKLAIIIPAVAIVLAAAIAACVYFGLTANIQVSISAPTNKDSSSYIYRLMFSYSSDYITSSKKEQIDKVNSDLNDFYETFSKEQEKPYFVEAKYENIDKKTVITFKGEVTDKETGNLVDFNKVFSYDFIITNKINYNGHDDFKYFV